MAVLQSFQFYNDEPFTPARLTVAVGPNNGGKSRFLRELAKSIVEPTSPRLVIENSTVDTEALK